MKRVITITREFGSGGRTIAKELAQRLGWEYYDYSLISRIAAQSGYAPEYIEQHGEDITSWNNWNMGFFSLSDSLFLAQRKVIMDLAEKGNCVIVGRCADYILEDRDDVLNVFVYADEDWKKNRVRSIYGEDEKGLEKRFKEKNKKRASYYKYYTGRSWGRAWYYDLCLKTSRLGIEECVNLIQSALQS
ncbi:AAA family ATPase [uncultured Faecalibaculum sp.]|uniref:cytidylate kinase-like family protein n=1 Tax=uncultured Faecalibaculum sp. TaxID=1729681 RepID=UPI0025E6B164|nr:cytidylate kinase-like family protein [uncultured Faecalibaculum sp.]